MRSGLLHSRELLHTCFSRVHCRPPSLRLPALIVPTAHLHTRQKRCIQLFNSSDCRRLCCQASAASAPTSSDQQRANQDTGNVIHILRERGLLQVQNLPISHELASKLCIKLPERCLRDMRLFCIWDCLHDMVRNTANHIKRAYM